MPGSYCEDYENDGIDDSPPEEGDDWTIWDYHAAEEWEGEQDEERWACQFGDACLMPGDHMASECHTVEMMEQQEDSVTTQAGDGR